MKDKGRFLKWLRRPHGVGLVLLYIVTALCMAGAILLTVFANENEVVQAVSYAVYGVAALSLGYTVYTIVIYAPHVKRKAVAHAKKNKFAARMLEEYDFKTLVFSVISLAITVAFSVMYLVSAINYRSVWYYAIFAYYIGLVLFRSAIIIASRKIRKKFGDDEDAAALSKWKIFLASGAFLVPLEFAMAGAITVMIVYERTEQSGMIMAIANAAYTFYKIAMAIYNLVKARRFDDPVVRSLRDLNFADACMSAVSLTVLMLSTFTLEENYLPNVMWIKATVGFAACVAIIAMAAYMIIYSVKKINALKGEETHERE